MLSIVSRTQYRETMKKAQLHPSDLQLFLSCGERFRRKKIEGERESVGTALILGTAVHHGAALTLKHKASTGALLEDAEVSEAVFDAVAHEFDSAPILLMPEEVSQGVEAVRGHVQDLSVQASHAHSREVAPTVSVDDEDDLEWRWVLETPEDMDYDLAGTADVVETRDDGLVVRDLKVVKKMPSQSECDQSGQLTAYAMAAEVIRRKPVVGVKIDAVVKPTKRLPARAVVFDSARTAADMDAFTTRLMAMQSALRAGVFVPANPAEPWAPCGWCGYRSTCRFVSNRPVSVAMSPEAPIHRNKGGNHATRVRASVRTVRPGDPEWG